MSENRKRALRLKFDSRLKLELHGAKITANAGGRAAHASSRRRRQRGVGLDQRRIRRPPQVGPLVGGGGEPLDMDPDATGKVKVGANVIAIRVWNDAETGGLYRRGFLRAPKR